MQSLTHVPRHLSRLLRISAFGAVTLVSMTVLGAVFWLSREFDEDARQSSHLMVESGLNALVASNEIIGRDYAYWTEAFNAVNENNIDWLNINVGSGVLADTMHVLVIAGGPLPETLGWADEATGHLGTEDFAAFRDAGFDLAKRRHHEPGDEPISTFVEIDETLFTIAVDWIIPHDRELGADEEKALLVSAVRLDEGTTARWGEMFLLDGLNFVRAAGDIQGRQAIPISGPAGPLRYLVWAAPQPGLQALHAVSVPLVLALLLVTVTLGLGAFAISRLALRLERALVAAEAADRTKSEFIASLSHELRTPMNGIVGILELLQLEDLTDGQCELVAVGLSSAEAQLALINHLLSFGQIDSGNRHISIGSFAPADAVREVVSLAMPLARSKGLQLQVLFEGPVDAPLLGDRLAIRQIATNLICNAIKFTQMGAVSVELKVSRTMNGNRFRIAVSDTGPGIKEADTNRIFESFVQLDGAEARAAGGVGLGLAISRRLANAMNGTLSVNSIPGQGATFVFEVTLEAPVAAPDTQKLAA